MTMEHGAAQSLLICSLPLFAEGHVHIEVTAYSMVLGTTRKK